MRLRRLTGLIASGRSAGLERQWARSRVAISGEQSRAKRWTPIATAVFPMPLALVLRVFRLRSLFHSPFPICLDFAGCGEIDPASGEVGDAGAAENHFMFTGGQVGDRDWSAIG